MDLDYYRSLPAEGILRLARDNGIDADMAVALAETLDRALDQGMVIYGHRVAFGGVYRFNQRSDA